MYVSLIHPHLYIPVKIQYCFLSFLFIFWTVISEGNAYSERSDRGHHSCTVPTPHNQQKKKKRERENSKGTIKMIKNLKLEGGNQIK